MFRVLIILSGGLLMSGCAALAPSLLSLLPTSSPAPQVYEQTRVSLAKDNFTLVKTNVWGQSEGFSLVGFITICPPSLATAMSRMYAAAGMHPGQAQTVAHVIIERTSSYWILFGIPKINVRADIVQFNPEVKRPEGEQPQQLSEDRRSLSGD